MSAQLPSPDPSVVPTVAPNVVIAWHASSVPLTDRVLEQRACTVLRADDERRYARFRAEDDRRMFLLGRLMARVLVARAIGAEPMAWTWREGPHGRPEMVGETHVHFNLAHSAGLVVCVIAPDRDVGIDVEDLARRPVDPAVVRRYCAPDEIADIDARPAAERHARFLRFWTLKEAYLKARGLGISLPLADIDFSAEHEPPEIAFRGSLARVDAGWAFHLARPTPGHLVAMAASWTDGARPAFHLRECDVRGLVDAVAR
jgi:4'-phosphopantetheinyl transferase